MNANYAAYRVEAVVTPDEPSQGVSTAISISLICSFLNWRCILNKHAGCKPAMLSCNSCSSSKALKGVVEQGLRVKMDPGQSCRARSHGAAAATTIRSSQAIHPSLHPLTRMLHHWDTGRAIFACGGPGHNWACKWTSSVMSESCEWAVRRRSSGDMHRLGRYWSDVSHASVTTRCETGSVVGIKSFSRARS